MYESVEGLPWVWGGLQCFGLWPYLTYMAYGSLFLAPGSFDVCLLLFVLHHIGEAARVYCQKGLRTRVSIQVIAVLAFWSGAAFSHHRPYSSLAV